jgi:ABC-2 type transport system permease protein
VLTIVTRGLVRRRAGLFGWCLGLIGVVALLALAYPTVRDDQELDRTFAGLSPGVRQLLGLSAGAGITSPIGYLNSQFFANLLPVMLLVLAISAGAWAIAGDEASGTLELLLANPVSRPRLAMARAACVAVMVALLTATTALALLVAAPPAGLTAGVSGSRLVAATVAAGLAALAYAAVAFAVGAATGHRGAAVATAGALAVIGYVVEGLAPVVRVLRPIRAVSPWHWLLGNDPLRAGLAWQAWLLPLLAAVVLVALGTALFGRRDVH